MFGLTSFILLISISALSAPYIPDHFGPTEKEDFPVVEEKIPYPVPHRWELIPQLSVISPTHMALVSSRYEIPYATVLSGFPAIHLSLASPLKKYGSLQTYGLIRAGFSYKKGVYDLPASSGDSSYTDLSLLWIPLSVGAKLQYGTETFPFLKPAITLGIGIQHFRQNSELSELRTNVWLPYFYVTPQIGFFEGGSQWFNGFTFGLSYIDSLGFARKVRAFSYDLSFSILL